jgi:phosphatidate cytidylyltransferase
MALACIFSLLWFLVGVTRTAPTMNAAVTVFGIVYIGLLGSYAALILRVPDGHGDGRGIFIGVVLAVVANDVGALLIGRQAGRAPLAPTISPNKTWEGTLGGALVTVIVSFVVLGFVGIEPWDNGSAIALGLVVALAAPLGDLCESMMKRDLGLKDMGTVLPGHGGLLDRFDALLFCLPATYYLCRLLDIF